MMRKNKVSLFIALGILNIFYSHSQTNRLTGSPYSLFGLGVETSSNIGKNSALGGGGFALNDPNLINIQNPASFGTESTNSFIFDIGFLGELSTIQNNTNEENRLASNFSSLAFSGNIDDKSTFSLAILPYSDVGYSLLGIESNIEGSFDQFNSNIFGTGALNNLNLSYGRTLFKGFRLGAKISYLFGSIEETEIVQTGLSGLTVLETSNYNGLQFGLGLQTDLTKFLTYGGAVNFPTLLSGTQDRTVDKVLDLIQSPVESETDIDLEKFELPFEINNGIRINPWNNLYFNFDHSFKAWSVTEQQDNIGDFVDQNVFSAGAEYSIRPGGFKFIERVQFRTGYYYDSGYLSVRGENISSEGFSFGIGLPFGRRNSSMVNISYTNTNRGSTNTILVQENINSVNINISLKDIWFLKKKIN
ncbi:hypothetical protein [Flagellimonas sp.]|uniref:hypothetical protein n=1 Tax=Flagellimonas sp. TaxID=2058762 RepID=UPI003F4A5C92